MDKNYKLDIESILIKANGSKIMYKSNKIVPEIFEFNYKAYLDIFGGFSIKIVDNKIIVDSGLEQHTITSSEEKWKDFWKKMDQIGIWNWFVHYEPQLHSPEDGYVWNLKIELGDKKIESSGSNAYPGREIGEIVDVERSPTFNILLDAIEKLISLKIDIF